MWTRPTTCPTVGAQGEEHGCGVEKDDDDDNGEMNGEGRLTSYGEIRKDDDDDDDDDGTSQVRLTHPLPCRARVINNHNNGGPRKTAQDS
jgi:hypothetical protein